VVNPGFDEWIISPKFLQQLITFAIFCSFKIAELFVQLSKLILASSSGQNGDNHEERDQRDDLSALSSARSLAERVQQSDVLGAYRSHQPNDRSN
jgi:hypothetical protein